MGLAVLPIAAVAVTALATSAAAYGEIRQSQAQAATAKYNQQMEAYDASVQKQQGQVAAQDTETQGELIQGKAKAAAAAAGLAGGSSTDIQYVDLVRNDQQANQELYRGTIGAYNATSQSNLDGFQAGFDQTSGYLSAGGTLLSGASKAFGQSGLGTGPTPGGVFGSTTTSNQPTF